MCFSLFPAFFLPSCLSLSNDWSCHVQFPSALFVLPVCFPTYSNASGLHRATGPCRSKGTGDLLEAPQPLPLDNGPGTSAATRGRPRPPGPAWPGARQDAGRLPLLHASSFAGGPRFFRPLLPRAFTVSRVSPLPGWHPPSAFSWHVISGRRHPPRGGGVSAPAG